ncbi:hypothetical protein CsSME_00042420 [Camellia sinensis var. sinensis]
MLVLHISSYELYTQMVRELDEILRQQIAQPANSCKTENGVSFLDQIICPLYEVVAAEAANNDNGRAPHSSWRNYDDFNEYFWSLHCFELSWPWRKSSSFFLKPTPRSKNVLNCGGSKRQGKTSFVEHRTFLHLYHSFHRLWIFLVLMFQVCNLSLGLFPYLLSSFYHCIFCLFSCHGVSSFILVLLSP